VDGGDENVSAILHPHALSPPQPRSLYMATPDDSYMATLLANMQRHEEERIEAAKTELKRHIIPRLRKRGVVLVEARYSGYGDSGCVETVEYFDAQNKLVTVPESRSKKARQIEDVLNDFLPTGFEVNDGGQGEIKIDVEAGAVTIEHQENFVQHTDSTMEYTL
jgi:hypothetical protein